VVNGLVRERLRLIPHKQEREQLLTLTGLIEAGKLTPVLGRRVQFPGNQIARLDELIVPLVTVRAPGLPSLHGVGPDTAALLLIAAGDRPGRLRSEAAWAHMCAVAPIPASSGKTRRHRLNRGGNREANHALRRIVITRMSSHPETRAHAERRTREGLTKKEIIRCLKRYVAREVYPCLRG
jgi:transposase